MFIFMFWQARQNLQDGWLTVEFTIGAPQFHEWLLSEQRRDTKSLKLEQQGNRTGLPRVCGGLLCGATVEAERSRETGGRDSRGL